MQTLTTITGKPATVATSTRLTITDYLKLKTKAEKAQKSVSALLQEWISERLQESETQHERV